MLTDVSLLHVTLDDDFTPAWPPVWREGVLQSWLAGGSLGSVVWYYRTYTPKEVSLLLPPNTPDSGLLIAAIMV